MNGIFSTKKAKSVKIISLSLFFTALIYLSSNASSFSSHLEKVKFVLLIEQVASYGRTLLEDNDINRICNKAEGGLLDLYKSENKITFDKKKSSEKIQAIIDYIRDSDSSHIKDYIPRIVVYAVFIVIAVLYLIGWLFYCCCCCCPCCCCKKKKEENCCKFSSCLIVLILYGGVVVGSIVALALSK